MSDETTNTPTPADAPADRVTDERIDELRLLLRAKHPNLVAEREPSGSPLWCVRGDDMAPGNDGERDDFALGMYREGAMLTARALEALPAILTELLARRAAAADAKPVAEAVGDALDKCSWQSPTQADYERDRERVMQALYAAPPASPAAAADGELAELRRLADEARAKLAAAEGEARGLREGWHIIERAGEVTLTVGDRSVEAWRTPSGTPNWCIEVGAVGAANTMLECLTMGLAALAPATPAEPAGDDAGREVGHGA